MMRASRRNVRDEPRTQIEEEEQQQQQEFRMFLLPMELLHNGGGDDDDDGAHGQESRQHEATHKKK